MLPPHHGHNVMMEAGVKFHSLPSVLAIGGLQQPVETVYADEGSVFMGW